jgi:hypothetical protein
MSHPGLAALHDYTSHSSESAGDLIGPTTWIELAGRGELRRTPGDGHESSSSSRQLHAN